MIIFEKVKYKNILSVGNKFIEIDLKEHGTNVILGKNDASGKSNGSGKCLRGSTEIDINFTNEQTKEKFINFFSSSIRKPKLHK